MAELFAEATSASEPAFWYGIPHGYLQLDLNPPRERIEAMVEQALELPAEMRDQAEQVLQFYAGFVTSLTAQNVRACAVGLHPNNSGGFASSTLTVSMVPASGVNPKLVIASMAGTAADAPDEGMRPLELPCGLGFLSEEKRRTVAPGRPPEGSDGPLMGTVWQGTVALTGSGTPDIIVIQLVTSAIEMADDYRNILLGVAHTVTFRDPSFPQGAGYLGDLDPEPGSAAAAVRSDFG
ncbi:hypothetical protein AB0P36_16470 [Streptomyces flavidovirens]|uniref:hypothetical protein n=1 Tax=Streptomyces flavidovirens TaxID=67298 RepID=UPI00343FF5DD